MVVTQDELFRVRRMLANADKRDRLRLVGTRYGSAREALTGWEPARYPTEAEAEEYTARFAALTNSVERVEEEKS